MVPNLVELTAVNVGTYGCFHKYGYPEIIHFNRVFHYQPSILGYPKNLETPMYHTWSGNGYFSNDGPRKGL